MIADRLRKSVLKAAMKGQLTEHDVNDDLISDLLYNIKTQKDELISLKIIRNDKSIKEIDNDDETIPKNWAKIRLGSIAEYKKGPFGSSLKKSIFVEKSKNSIKVYEQKNAIQKDWSLGNYYIKKEYYESKMKGFSVKPGDIIISTAGTIGEVYQLPEEANMGIINQALMRVRLFQGINSKFFSYLFASILSEIQGHSSGSAIKNIPPFSILKNIVILLPSTKEQNRIVEKLEKILPLIDKLGKYENELKLFEDKFLERIKNSVLQSVFESNNSNFNNLELLPFELLNKLKKDRDKLIKIDEIRKERKLSQITKDDEVFEIPENWIWIKLGEVASINTGANFKKDDQVSKGIRVLRGGNINNGKIMLLENDIFIPYDKIKMQHFVKKGDLLTPSVTSLENVGKIGLISDDYNDIVHGGFVFNIRPYTRNDVFSKYLYYYLQTPKNLSILKSLTNKSGQAFYNLGKEKFRNILIPISALDIQQSIVEYLEYFFKLL